LFTDSSVLRPTSCSSLLWCTFSIPVSSAVVLHYNFLFVIQFCWRRGSQSVQRLCWFMFLGVAGGVLSGACCVVLTCLFYEKMCRQVWSLWWW
jgi:hypothetical protein